MSDGEAISPVVIRAVSRWDDECNSAADVSDGDEDSDTWRSSAGGGITVLSTEVGEWEEMKAELNTVLGLFEGATQAQSDN